MDHYTLKKLVKAMRSMEQMSSAPSTLGLIFDNDTLSSVLYKSDMGYCSFGGSDGEAYIVDYRQFMKMIDYLDLLAARKHVGDYHIDFRDGDKFVRLEIKNSEKIELEWWDNGERLDVRHADIFSVEDTNPELKYYISGGFFDFSGSGYWGHKKMVGGEKFKLQLNHSFVEIFEEGFEITKISDGGVYFFTADLEIFLLSELVSDSTGSDRFIQEVSSIQAHKKMSCSSGDSVGYIIESLKELSNLSGGSVNILGKDDCLELNITNPIHARKRLKIKSSPELYGSVGRCVVNTLHRFRGSFDTVLGDDVHILFSGPEFGLIFSMSKELA